MIVRKRIRVSGRVQGVYYRARTRDEALALNLTGFVMNEPTGTVYMEVEGELPDVEKLIVWARQGPALAQVDHLDMEEMSPIGGHGFDIRR